MKIFQFVLVATVIAATVAFPTPQEVKPSAETKEQDEHVPMVQKIEIHVEVKAVSADMKIPAMVTVTEVKEHLEKSTEAVIPVEAAKATEVVKTADVMSSESVESSEVLKPVEAVKFVKPVKPSVEAEVVTETSKTEESTTKVLDVKTAENVEVVPAKAEETVSEKKSAPEVVDQVVEATSEPKPAVVEPEPEKVETKAVEVKIVLVESKAAKSVESQTNDDSDEDNSSEESTTELVMESTMKQVKASPIITLEEAVKENTMESVKEQPTTVMSEKQTDEVMSDVKADEVLKGEDVKSVETKQGAKSVSDEKVIPIVKELPNEKLNVDAEPVYRTIPVAVVHDEPTKENVEEVAVKIVETVEVSGQKKEDNPTVKTTDVDTVKADEEKSKVSELQMEDVPVVKTVGTVKAEADQATVEASPAEAVEAKSEKSEEPKVFVVEATKAADVKELEATVQASEEPAKETEVKAVESIKEEGSSTKAAPSESETTEKKVEDSSVSSSTASKATANMTNASEVTETAEELTTEETTTTTAVPVKAEGKKGKKKLPANIRGYSKRLQQDQKKLY